MCLFLKKYLGFIFRWGWCYILHFQNDFSPFQRTGDLHWSDGKHWQGGTSSLTLFFNLLRRSCSRSWGAALVGVKWLTWHPPLLRGGGGDDGDVVVGLWRSWGICCCCWLSPWWFPPPVPPFWGWAGPKKWAVELVEFGSKWTSSRTLLLPVDEEGDEALVGLKCWSEYSSLFCWYG